jgi:endonuclease/exonuclease/phosphatase family metal-dependent hydrolase
MATKIRIATFNVENLDDLPSNKPTLDERIALMRPQLLRIDADIVCLQEVNAQKEKNKLSLRALDKFLIDTRYADYERAFSLTDDKKELLPQRNLVILSRFPILEQQQYKHIFAPEPLYRQVTANPAETQAQKITWDRPILYAKLKLDKERVLHVINLHLKSRIPSKIQGQQIDDFTWKSASGWAEGSFISSVKRVGQALETRQLIDNIFDRDEDAMILVCGDLNADADDVPVEAIRGDVENTSNPRLAKRVMIPCERTIPEPSRFSLLHQGKKQMFDHILVSRSLLAYYRGTEIHNELLHDESVSFATDEKFPESDHAPVIAEFELRS